MATTNDLPSIPRIDLSAALTGDRASQLKAARDIDRACRDIGFFTVVGHGIPLPVFKQVYADMARFFAQPLADKNRCRLPDGSTLAADAGIPLGYSSVLEENVYAYSGVKNMPNDYVEKLSVGRGIFDDTLELPFPGGELGAQFQASIKPYYRGCEKVVDMLGRLFALALDLPPDFFASRVNASQDSMRLHRYPGHEPGFANHQGIGEHKDGTLITLLTSTLPGLEVKTHSGEWITPAFPELDCFVVNIGDLMMQWSNDTYVSTLHRVVLTAEQRYSIVFFKTANADVVIEPFDKFCQSTPPRYAPIKYSAWQANKLNDMYQGTPAVVGTPPA